MALPVFRVANVSTRAAQFGEGERFSLKVDLKDFSQKKKISPEKYPGFSSPSKINIRSSKVVKKIYDSRNFPLLQSNPMVGE